MAQRESAHARQVRKSTVFILQQLVGKDFKLKYRRSVLGMLWSVLNPLLMMAVMTLVFSNMFKFPIEHYPLYLILGTVLFSLMNDATSGAMSSSRRFASRSGSSRWSAACSPW